MLEIDPLAGCFEQAALALRPDPELTVSQWADAHRFLSQTASGEPGPWRTERTPYLKEVMDCLSPRSPIEKVVFMKGSQVGGTEAGNNWIGYVIHHAPGPMLAVQPTVEMGKRWSRQRIAPLIEGTPALRERVKEPRARDSGNTIQSKEFPGGLLVVTGANSAVGLRSMPVRYLFLDEVDAYPFDADGEGDPVGLAIQRTVTFANRKVFLVSTPTIEGLSRIELEYQASDRRRFHVPCPECGAMQVLEDARLRWPKDRPELASYHCVACEASIPSHRKPWMLARGEWRAEAAGPGSGPGTGSLTAGFHLPGLCSPWLSWADIATRKHAAQGDAAMKVYVNTIEARTWRERGEAPDWQRLYERREDYRIGTVPAGGLLLTAGCDVQRDRIELSVWAWGRGKESWLVEHRVLGGDTARPQVWHELTGLLAETWRHESGVLMPLRKLAIDSGFATQEVYTWVRRQPQALVMAVKGVERGSALVGLPTAVDVNAAGKRLRCGVKVHTVATGLAKLELFANLRKDPPVVEEGETFPPGYVHLPKVDAELCRQLCAEQLVTSRNKRGYAVASWQKLRERNEALDCYVYARAAAAVLGLDRFEERHWLQIERQLGIDGRAAPKVPPAREPQTAPTSTTRTRRPDWLGGRERSWLRRS